MDLFQFIACAYDWPSKIFWPGRYQQGKLAALSARLPANPTLTRSSSAMHLRLSDHPLPALLLAGLLAWSLPAAAEPEADTADSGKPAAVLPLEDLRTFTKVYEHIRKGYVDEIDDKTLLEYAIKGMLAELDPHSAYLDASSFEDLQMNTTGEFGGLGIEVGMEDGFVKVISPIDDTPAQKAGIQAGDLIIKIDEKSVKGLGLGDAIKLMRGPKGSEIDLTIVRKGLDQPLEVTLVRDLISVQSVRSRMLEDGFGYIRIAQFQVNTGADMIKEITKLKAAATPLKGLILDLRNNPGGVLQASVEVADAFLEDGLIVYTKGRIENADMRYDAQPGDETGGLPLVVLINDGSASASEIVAGALQDHRRALIMGTDSFGKGSVQTVIPLSDEQAIKLTTALYYTPNDRSIQAQGITPDIVVERANITPVDGAGALLKEADLVGHLGNGNGGEERGSKAAKPTRDSGTGKPDSADQSSSAETTVSAEVLLKKDNQVFEALNLLKGLYFFRQQGTQPATSSARPASSVSTAE
jgi:carboxyl-terminal processing protease